jgi:hypothetical protein
VFKAAMDVDNVRFGPEADMYGANNPPVSNEETQQRGGRDRDSNDDGPTPQAAKRPTPR